MALVNTLGEHAVVADDPAREAPNPAWGAADAKLRQAYAQLDRLQSEYGLEALSSLEDRRRTMRGFRKAQGKLEQKIGTSKSPGPSQNQFFQRMIFSSENSSVFWHEHRLSKGFSRPSTSSTAGRPFSAAPAAAQLSVIPELVQRGKGQFHVIRHRQ
jgi:hypothetical protein